MARARLSGRVGAGLDPCVAMQVTVELADGQEREVVFTFGAGRDLADARTLVQPLPRHRRRRARRSRACGRTGTARSARCTCRRPTRRSTSWPTAGCSTRCWRAACGARSGFYQSGGAFGFRDQLQDAMALVHAEPAILREQILRAAARQFREGDVQHWWHPPLGRGVRTRISDDYLWLPYAVCRYVAALGDTGVLDEKVPFLEGRAGQARRGQLLRPARRARRSRRRSTSTACARSSNGLRFGEHGLPLMGSGDWNDGMNLVGEHGKGESVWLAFFLYDVLVQFADARAPARRRRVRRRAARPRRRKLRAEHRARTPGTASGTAARTSTTASRSARRRSPECQIDSLPQSWAVLSRRRRSASARGRRWRRVDARLVERELGVDPALRPAVRHVRRSSPATSRATCPACARTAASTRTPRSGR